LRRSLKLTERVPESLRMSTLDERLWAVLSERGREAAGLTYEEAAVLVRELRATGVGAKGGKISGLCIVTARAGEHVAPAKKSAKAKGKRQKLRRQ
jgi:hypothetical protein